MGTVAATRPQTPSARSILVDVPDWEGNIAGQHVDVRLTAPDGYTAVRSYSLASSGNGPQVELAVDRLPTGEVSPYLVDELREGDQLELRGPLGGWFVWHPDDTAPIQLIAGGSGVVPLMAMLRSHAASGSSARMQLLYSVRSPEDAFFTDELQALGAASPAVSVTMVYTRVVPEGWPTTAMRISRDILKSASIPPEQSPGVFVCGPTAFVEAAADWLVELGYPAATVKTERFGGI